jgi:opacity protein-like surface antigen
MSRLRRLAIIGALAQTTAAMIGFVPDALAADMPQNFPPPPIKRPALLAANGGWYVRGDVGYYWGQIGGAQSAPGYANPTDNSLGNGFTGGVGAGYKSQWLRTDVTLDYTAPMKYQGTVATANDTTAKVTAVTALFNGYLDLGTWYRATPYIGAGAGVSQLYTSDYTSTASPPFTGGLSNTQWKFAWAGMAGVAYAVGPNLLVDVGYRYLNFGDVTTQSDAFGAMTLKNLAAHEARVGFRWNFDDLPLVR